MTEFVFVLKRRDLFEDAAPVLGFRPFAREALERKYLRRIRERGFFLERARAERDPDFKQIIPYTLVIADDKVFTFRRLDAQSEARLRRKLSVGIGGHIDPPDAGPDPVRAGCLRELQEELIIEGTLDPEPIGTINDDTNEVGAVHFGVVHRLRVPADGVRVRERDRLSGAFESPDELADRLRNGDDFETWSRLVLEARDRVFEGWTVAGRAPARGDTQS